MANTKKTMLTAMVTALGALSDIGTCTRELLLPTAAREASPYVGVLAAEEVVLVDDGTDVSWSLMTDLVLVCSTDIVEELIDVVKDAMLSGMATTISAEEVRVIGTQAVDYVDTHDHTSSRIVFEIIYTSTKGAA